jgi:UDP-N-acetylglucosamine 2-epimerase (non-hydrolysing)
LVHTGQNYDYTLNQIFFEDLELRQPDYFLDAVGNDLGETIGNIIAKSYKLMTEIKPDAFLVLGDTNSALAAISAKRLKIPIFHMEAGNRCFDENLPEETNRRIVDHIADINLCYSEHARRYLNAEGTAKERTYVVGSPMAEVLSAHFDKIKTSDILDRLGLEKGKYILLSAHREENIDDEDNFFALMNAVNAMAETYRIPIIYSTHPRSRKFIQQRKFQFNPLVRSLEPFGFSDYNHLQMNAFCVVSDSGTLPEESSYFNVEGYPFPAVCIRTSTERPEALDKGNFILGSITTEQVLQAVDMAVTMNSDNDYGLAVPDYMDENVSSKVVKLIQSYTGIIDKMVWRKH